MASDPIVAIEVGTTKVRVLVGEVREDGHLMITGVSEQASRGVRKGEIIHFDNALSCIRSALDEADTQSRVTINEVHLLLSGGDIQGMINRGTVPVMGPDHEITQDDIEHVLETAKAVSLPTEREVLHTIQQHFYIDDQHSVIDPEGMESSRLSVASLILHGVRSRFRNTVRVVKTANVDVQDFAFSGLCAALAVLTPEQKESGALVIDLGGGTTDYFAYANQTVAHAGSIAVGGDHITNDMALGLSIHTPQAERLKVEFGSAMVDLSDRDKKVPIPSEGGFAGQYVRLLDVQTIANARMEELFSLIRSQLKEKELHHALGAGVILTGGGARMRRVTELGKKVFEMPCCLGMPKNISGLASVAEATEYAAPVGMLRYAMKTPRKGSAGLPFKALLKVFFGK